MNKETRQCNQRTQKHQSARLDLCLYKKGKSPEAGTLLSTAVIHKTKIKEEKSLAEKWSSKSY